MTEEEHRREERRLDEAIEETFPASDAPANTLTTGAVSRETAAEPAAPVRDNVERSRFEIEDGGVVSFLRYGLRGERLTLLHTEVPAALRGRGIAHRLAAAALDSARDRRLTVVVICPFVRTYLERHPEAAEGIELRM